MYVGSILDTMAQGLIIAHFSLIYVYSYKFDLKTVLFGTIIQISTLSISLWREIVEKLDNKKIKLKLSSSVSYMPVLMLVNAKYQWNFQRRIFCYFGTSDNPNIIKAVK